MPINIQPQHPVGDLRDQASELLKEAYEAGHRAGYRAARVEIERRLSKADFSTLLSALLAQGNDGGAHSDLKPENLNRNVVSALGDYGAKKNVVRSVLIEAPTKGWQISDIVGRVQARGAHMTTPQVREALRSLKETEEAVCEDRRWWHPTDKLRGNAAKENGALHGNAASAPETDEGRNPSSFESQQTFGLTG